MFLKRGRQEGPTKVGEHYVGSQVSSHKLITTATAQPFNVAVVDFGEYCCGKELKNVMMM